MTRNGTNPRAQVPVADEAPTDPKLVIGGIPYPMKVLMVLGAAMCAVAGAAWGAKEYFDRYELKSDVAAKKAEAEVNHQILRTTDLDHERRIVGLEHREAVAEKRLDWMTSVLWEMARKDGVRVEPPPKEIGP